MKINWRVRFKNPVFWVNVILAVILPILAYFGVNWKQMTTWAALGSLLAQAVSNPVVCAAVAVSVWNAINDPTTEGLSDSAQAMKYSKPKRKWN